MLYNCDSNLLGVLTERRRARVRESLEQSRSLQSWDVETPKERVVRRYVCNISPTLHSRRAFIKAKRHERPVRVTP